MANLSPEQKAFRKCLGDAIDLFDELNQFGISFNAFARDERQPERTQFRRLNYPHRLSLRTTMQRIKTLSEELSDGIDGFEQAAQYCATASAPHNYPVSPARRQDIQEQLRKLGRDMNKVLRHLDTRMGHINDRPSAVSFISSREKLHEVLSGIQDLFNKYPLAGRAAELSPRRRNHLETIGSTFHANFGRD